MGMGLYREQRSRKKNVVFRREFNVLARLYLKQIDSTQIF